MISQMKFAVQSPQYRPRIMQFNVTSGAAQVEVITAAAFASTAQADFIVIYNTSGDSEALWLDKNAAGTAPTAAAYTNATIKTKVSISTGNTAIQVAAAIDAASVLTGVTLTANGDGTLTLTQSSFLNCSNATRSNADGSGNGSFTLSVTTEGVTPTMANGKFDATIVQTATGTYEITYKLPYLRAPEACVLTITDNRVPRITGSTNFVLTVEMQDLSGGAAANGNFSCIVLGSDSSQELLQY